MGNKRHEHALLLPACPGVWLPSRVVHVDAVAYVAARSLGQRGFREAAVRTLRAGMVNQSRYAIDVAVGLRARALRSSRDEAVWPSDSGLTAAHLRRLRTTQESAM